jgi:RNA polymerase sigma-70 factor (sigma-E family)
MPKIVDSALLTRDRARRIWDRSDFEGFAEATADRLRNHAYGMCRDWHLAQDLTQTALTKLYLVWGRASQADNIEAYAHTIVLRVYLDHRRLRSSAERTSERPPEIAYRDNPDLRLAMLDAVARLPARDRAIVLLRFWEDCSVERVADILGIPISMVKTQTRRSLAKLRELLGAEQVALFA